MVSVPAQGLLHMGVGVFRVLQIQALRNVGAVHLEGQEMFRLLEHTFTWLSAMIDNGGGEELETRLRKLLLLQEQTASHIVRNGQHRPDQPLAILQAAAELEAWIPIKIRNCALGSPARFPFVAALAYARASCSDAVLLQGGNNQFEEQALQRLRDEVSMEAYALCDNQTLYVLAMPRFPALLGYVLLRRGLGGAGSVQQKTSGVQMVAYEEQDTSWNPELAIFRQLLTKPHEGPPCFSLPLTTIADYEWLVHWAKLEKNNFNVHSIKEVKAKDILQSLGVGPESATLDEKSLKEILLAGSRVFDRFEAHFRSEFDCQPPFLHKTYPSIQQEHHFKNEDHGNPEKDSWIEKLSAMDFMRGAGYHGESSILDNFEPQYRKIFAYIFSRNTFVIRTQIFEINVERNTDSVSRAPALGFKIARVRMEGKMNDYKVDFAGSKNRIYELSPIKSKPGWWPTIYVKFVSMDRLSITYSPSNRWVLVESKFVDKIENGEEVPINWAV